MRRAEGFLRISSRSRCTTVSAAASTLLSSTLPTNPSHTSTSQAPAMAAFGSTIRALECAVAIQRAFAARNATVPEHPIQVRVGINAGEPIAEEADLFGTAVIVAARLAAAARGGEILAANVVKELAAGKAFRFDDRGLLALRGFDEPVRAFTVGWTE